MVKLTMEMKVFNNQILEDWLDHKANEILSKLGSETISDSEMLVLVLKAQTNHFNHLDGDLSNKICILDKRIDELESKFDKKFEILDHKIDSRFFWSLGVMIAGFSGIYLKLFFK